MPERGGVGTKRGGFRREGQRTLPSQSSKDGSDGYGGGEQDRDCHRDGGSFSDKRCQDAREEMGVEEREENSTTKAIRIYVGGLGQNVTSDELCGTFSKMGVEIESVDIIRTKDRSFAYINFSHQSSDSLPKLFNTYNGCVWKGGKLRLEKAKEDYLVRLKREWDEDAQSATNSSATNVDVNVNNTEPAEKLKKGTTSEKKQLRLFFPKLRKVKSLPFTGTGKHKYSFRRVEVLPLPTYFCDCEEHCGSLYSVEEKQMPHVEEQAGGINEQEIELMNSVMYKLFEKENVPVVESNDAETAKEEIEPDEENNDLQFDEIVGTDDDMIINVVSRGKKTMTSHQDSKSNKRQASSDGTAHPKKKTRYNEESSEAQLKELAIPSGEKDSEPKPSSEHFSSTFSWSQKSSWKELIGDKSKNSITISDILPDTSSKKKKQLKSSKLQTSDDSKTKKSLKNKRQRDKLERKVEDTADAQKGGTDVTEKSQNEYQRDQSDDEVEDTADAQKGGIVEIEKALSDYQRDQSDEDVEDTAEAQPTKPDFPSEKHEHPRDQLDEQIEDDEEAQPSKPDSALNNIEGSSNKTGTASEKVGRGSAWLHKSSWTQLVASNTSTSFSITQIIPGLAFEKQEPSKPDHAVTSTSRDNAGGKVIEKRESSPVLVDTERDDNNASSATTSKPQAAVEPFFSGSVAGLETCSFKRSDESLKEFAKLKAALSRTRKRTDKKK